MLGADGWIVSWFLIGGTARSHFLLRSSSFGMAWKEMPSVLLARYPERHPGAAHFRSIVTRFSVLDHPMAGPTEKQRGRKRQKTRRSWWRGRCTCSRAWGPQLLSAAAGPLSRPFTRNCSCVFETWSCLPESHPPANGNVSFVFVILNFWRVSSATLETRFVKVWWFSVQLNRPLLVCCPWGRTGLPEMTKNWDRYHLFDELCPFPLEFLQIFISCSFGLSLSRLSPLCFLWVLDVFN
jgi:hypothetical protein